jgi:hypothetical protein
MTPLPLLALALALAAAPARAALSLSDKDAYILLVVNERCTDAYFARLDWLSLAPWLAADSDLRACVAASVKKALGYGIVAGGALVNAQQVHMLWRKGNARGLAIASQYQTMWSNILGAVFMALNGARLDKYGETILQAAGPAAIVALMWRWQPPGAAHAAAVVAATAALAALAAFSPEALARAAAAASGGALAPSPSALLLALLFVSNAFFWSSRLGQIYTTHRARSDASQSIIALAANALGSAVRAFSGQEVPGIPQDVKPILFAVGVFNSALNWVMVGQWVWYNVLGKGRGAAARGGRAAGSQSPVPQPARRAAAIAAEKGIAAASQTPKKRAGSAAPKGGKAQ